MITRVEIPIGENRALTMGTSKEKPRRDKYGARNYSLSPIRPRRGGWIMTPELRSWMRAHAGASARSQLAFDKGEGDYYYDAYYYQKVMEFQFRDPDTAMLFKLMFGGS